MALWAAGMDLLLAANDIVGRGNFVLTWWWGKNPLAERNLGPVCSLCLLPEKYNLTPLKSSTVHEIALLAVNGHCWLLL